MEWLYDFWSGLNQNFSTMAVAVSVLLALLNCFLGYRLMRFWCALAGFFVGFILSCMGCSALDVSSAGIYLLAGVLVGIALGAAAYILYKVGVFLLCATMTGSLVLLLVGVTPWTILLAPLAAIAVGILAVFMVRPVVILVSAIQGGLHAGQFALPLFGIVAPMPALIVGVALVIAGVAVQLRTTVKHQQAPPTTNA